MKCEEAAEFVSALCDGETIPRVAAEHIDACKACRERLKDYVQIGAEMRRVASLATPEEVPQKTWAKRERITWRWWAKGWETMRIPRFAFALLLVTIVVLGSSLAVMRVRAQSQGKVLLLTATFADDQSWKCALLLNGVRRAQCASMRKTESGILGEEFRVISEDGNRVELGVREKFIAFNSGLPLGTLMEDLRNSPENAYWFEPGGKLEIAVAGAGPMVVTGELMDHLPTFRGDFVDLDPKQNELRVVSPLLLRDQRVVVDFKGYTGLADGMNEGVEIYSPGEGRYVLSLSPLEGAVEGSVFQSRIAFEIDSHQYEFLMAAPVARGETVWVLHQPDFKPSQQWPGNRDDKQIGAVVDLRQLGLKAPGKN